MGNNWVTKLLSLITMVKRYTVLLRIEGQSYKFLSIHLGNDPSFYIYTHHIDERSPLQVANSTPLLKSKARVTPSSQDSTTSERGDQTHFSIHPQGNRLYLKKHAEGGVQQHLIEECELQHFNKNHFRLHMILTPGPPSYLPKYNRKTVRKDEELVVFEWESPYCPQISLYELDDGFDVPRIDSVLPPAHDIRVITSDGVHSALALHLKSTAGQPNVWLPRFGIFARVISREDITKSRLQEILNQNGLSYDISSIPDHALISD